MCVCVCVCGGGGGEGGGGGGGGGATLGGGPPTTPPLLCALHAAFGKARACLRAMGEASGVDIEPSLQSRLLDATSSIPGVVAAGVPGAGGHDAVFCLVVGGRGAEEAVEALWAAQTELSVTRLPLTVGPGRGCTGSGLLVTHIEE